jgi:hypothetical protein
MSQNAAEVFELIKRSHRAESTGSRTMHEAFPLLESELRFVALLAAATARSAGNRSLKIGRSPGLGEWISFLRSVGSELHEVGTDPARLVETLVGDVLGQYDRGIPAAPSKLRAVKALRDHAMHGGVLPDDRVRPIRDQVDRLVERISDAIVTSLAHAAVSFQATSSPGDHRLGFVWAGGEVPLWPYMYAHRTTSDAEAQLLVFASFTKAKPTYQSFGDGPDVDRHPSGEVLLSALGSAIKSRPLDRQFADFVTAVGNDVQGFIETDTEPIWVEEGDGFEYRWEKATAEGTERRWDQFRLGRGDVRLWQSEDGGWVEYPRFLRVLAHWRTVATRLRQGLVRIEEALDLEEREALGWEPARVEIRPAELEVFELGGARIGRKGFSSLFESVDKDLESNRGETEVVFINGEAGIGKTRAMVHWAKKRAQDVEAGADLPLFLYVRSTGHVLESLDTVVAAAVTSTRNLTEEAVRALCRNGLMTLFIDGFDELLGGVGYRDAIASLRPWLIALGGRGVLVVSARSSYYLGQYRSSLNRAQLDNDLRVRHRIANVKRWDAEQVENFLKEFNVPLNQVRTLSPPDRQLLGLPFFARAFAETYRKDPEIIKAGVSLRQLLLDQYLIRESGKLNRGRENSPLLSRDEMHQLFEMLAEEMASNEQREAGVEDLEILAALVTNDDGLATRPTLKERLTVLCGLAVDPGEASSGGRRFRFQHELFFDQFLAGAAARQLSGGQVGYFFEMLRASQWRTATVMGVVTEVGAETVADVLADYPPYLKASMPVGEDTAANNLGSLWAAVIQTTGRADYHIRGAHFAEGLDLSDVNDVDLALKDCELASLTLPLSSPWTVALTNSTIAELTAKAPNLHLQGLTGIQHKYLMRMITVGKYLENQTGILAELIKAGALVIDPPSDSEDSKQSIRVQAAERFLTRMENRGSNYVILRADNLQPDDNDTGWNNWTKEYGPSVWHAFTRGLLDTKLATAERFAASGSPKERFKLNVSIPVLLGRDPAPEATKAVIDDFWARMRSK